MNEMPLSLTEIRHILDGKYDILDCQKYQALYEYYLPEMPYGTAKARTGDPDNWMFHQLEREYKDI